MNAHIEICPGQVWKPTKPGYAEACRSREVVDVKPDEHGVVFVHYRCCGFPADRRVHKLNLADFQGWVAWWEAFGCGGVA